MEDNNITPHKRVSPHQYSDDSNSSSDKVVAGSFTENVYEEKPARDDISSYKQVLERDEHRRHIPEHLKIPLADNVGYSPAISNFGKKIGSLIKAGVAPVIKMIRFLQKRTNLTFWIIFAMVIGILVGRFAPAAGKEIKPLGDAFILMIKIIIVPLVFSVLVIGIAGHGDDIGKVGFLAIKTLIVSDNSE
jgi:hypothetical protein